MCRGHALYAMAPFVCDPFVGECKWSRRQWPLVLWQRQALQMRAQCSCASNWFVWLHDHRLAAVVALGTFRCYKSHQHNIQYCIVRMCRVFSATLTPLMTMMMMLVVMALFVRAHNYCNKMVYDRDAWCIHVKPFPLHTHHAHVTSNTEMYTQRFISKWNGQFWTEINQKMYL